MLPEGNAFWIQVLTADIGVVGTECITRRRCAKLRNSTSQSSFSPALLPQHRTVSRWD
jgi:hypothetical protein